MERGLWFASPLVLLGFLPQVFRAKPWVNRHDILLPLVLSLAIATEVLTRESLARVPEAITRRLASIRQKLPGFKLGRRAEHQDADHRADLRHRVP